MVKHRSRTRWPDDREVGWRCVRSAPCTRRRGARISWSSLKTKVNGFSRFGLQPVATVLVVLPQNHSLGFPGSGLKNGSCGLVIWPTKSSWWFLGLCLKTKWAMIYRLRHKTDRRMKTAQDTRWALTTCFTWKRVMLGFSSLASRLDEARHGWCTWYHRGGHVYNTPCYKNLNYLY
jgi:hypothetical protein